MRAKSPTIRHLSRPLSILTRKSTQARVSTCRHIFSCRQIELSKLRYITGRGGSAQGGLSAYLATLSNDYSALAIDPEFLAQSFEEQVAATREFCGVENGYVIANSYGAYLLLQSLIDQSPMFARVLLLSPVLGRAMDPDRMLLSRPPRERTLREAIEAQRLGLPFSLRIVTGREDEICDWKLAINFADALGINISVLDDEGHMISPAAVSAAVREFIND